MTRNRLEAFSDGVLAIIITIMVLELKVPHGGSLEALAPLAPVFLSYVLSFVYIGIYWNNHHHMLHTVGRVTGPILWANLHLLFWLSLLPFATGWMGENHFEAIPSALYGGVLLLAAISYYTLQRTIIASQGAHSVLRRAVGGDWKGKLSGLLRGRYPDRARLAGRGAGNLRVGGVHLAGAGPPDRDGAWYVVSAFRRTMRLEVRISMKNLLCTLTALAALAGLGTTARAQARVPVMILDGESAGRYHDWQATTPALKKMLDETGLFSVDVVTAPPADLTGFAPDFAKYQAVILNYDAPDERWPAPLKASFERYVSGGGGVVAVHGADNAFAGWTAFNEMVGVGGWRNRAEQAGPFWYYRDGKLVSDPAPGRAGSHGRRTPFQLTLRDASHPITRGLPKVWMHQGDELYARLRGPGKNMTVLATAFSEASNAGSDRDEPQLMVLSYGRGRIFHTTMGHDLTAMSSVDFVVLLQRGTEWAATGKVTQKVPAAFPSADTVSYRADIAAMDPDYRNGLDNLDLPRR
jgi:uncharacterized membrane protein